MSNLVKQAAFYQSKTSELLAQMSTLLCEPQLEEEVPYLVDLIKLWIKRHEKDLAEFEESQG